ncbi:hypothetical protein ABZY14_14310 [Streptomyces sp. NPDC006617]|uniref:hypothetical protein n=1 Tax=Streptomyces sp. NPDC006617 TaxID=3155354 RepID=UPI0033A9029A
MRDASMRSRCVRKDDGGFIESPHTHALAILGGSAVSGVEKPRARILSSGEVVAASRLLNVFIDRVIETRHRQLDLTGAQGAGADGAAVISVDDCVRAFRRLRKFYAKAAIHGEAMVLLFTESASSAEEAR